MKQYFLLAAFGLTALSSTAQWTLIWADEFGGNALDESKWKNDIGGWGFGNNESQYYTDGDNLTISNGTLVIEAREESFLTNNYTSGKIITKDLFDIKYGKIEARIKVPLGQGLWPAFWMLGSNIDQVSWPMCGEIDIMEHVNNEMSIHGTAHWDNNGHVYVGNSAVVNPSNYQVYSIEWNSSEIRWFLNGNQYHYQSILNNAQSTSEFHLPFYLILNLAVGGNWPGYPDASTVFPAQLEIDYVRAYKLDSEATTAELAQLDLDVYPNPVSDILNIDSDEMGTAQLIDLKGGVISETQLVSGTNMIAVDAFEPGMYLVSIQYEDGSVAKTKFIKK